MKKLIISYLILLAALVIGFACKKSDTSTSSSSGSSGSPGANEVWMQGNTFNPASLTVPVNTTVKWTNKDGVDHTVTSSGSEFSSGTVHNGGSFSHAFLTAGSYPYRCTIHSGMTGTITVQ